MNMDVSNKSISKSNSKIAIGTVQFGQTYGISNTHGQPNEKSARKILDQASKNKVTVLDTAPVYGKAEETLGRIIKPTDNFKIITKTHSITNRNLTHSPSTHIKKHFKDSLLRLRTNSIYGLLVHLSEDFLGPNGDDVWKTLTRLKLEGKTKYIGASCYSPIDARNICERYPIESIQFPLNVLDQSFITSGTIDYLTNKGVKMFTRSTFLQGLLLMNPERLPNGFSSAKSPLRLFHNASKKLNLTPLELSLKFVASIPNIKNIIVGVTQPSEMSEIFNALDTKLTEDFDFSTLAVRNESITNPSFWPPDEPKKLKFDFSILKE